jgi:hypothetical protein
LDHIKIGHRSEDDGKYLGVMITHYAAVAFSTRTVNG